MGGGAPFRISFCRSRNVRATRPDDLFRWHLAVGGLLSLVCVCLPVSIGRDLLYTAISYGCVGMLFVGVRRNRPALSQCWWLVAGGIAMWASADLLWAVYTWVLHISPFPSPADVLYLISYGLIAGGFGSFVRARRGDRERE